MHDSHFWKRQTAGTQERHEWNDADFTQSVPCTKKKTGKLFSSSKETVCFQPSHEEDPRRSLPLCWARVVQLTGRDLLTVSGSYHHDHGFDDVPPHQSLLGTAHCSNDHSGCLNHTCDEEIKEKWMKPLTHIAILNFAPSFLTFSMRLFCTA